METEQKKQMNHYVPPETHRKLNHLKRKIRLPKSVIVEMAIDDFYRRMQEERRIK